MVLQHTTKIQMIKLKDPNPLNFYGTRQVEILPPHFEVITTPIPYNINESIAFWIRKNLKGRFYIGKGITENNGQIEVVTKIGFEDAKEASYFYLACPYLKYR